MKQYIFKCPECDNWHTLHKEKYRDEYFAVCDRQSIRRNDIFFIISGKTEQEVIDLLGKINVQVGVLETVDGK